ncbi:hypothetical protein ZWY2020_006986 [Hordeum vulgare]|nr:hypothetical protein ZWY2020_006986 [Hordeum vulgare]
MTVMSARPAWSRLNLSLTSCHLSGKREAEKDADMREFMASSAVASLPCSSCSASGCSLARRRKFSHSSDELSSRTDPYHVVNSCRCIERARKGRGARAGGGAISCGMRRRRGSVMTVTARWWLNS